MKQNDMKDTEDTNSQKKPNRPAKETPELRVVSIDYNPGPDAQDRLRRLFTLLVKLATHDVPPLPERDSSSKGARQRNERERQTH